MLRFVEVLTALAALTACSTSDDRDDTLAGFRGEAVVDATPANGAVVERTTSPCGGTARVRWVGGGDLGVHITRSGIGRARAVRLQGDESWLIRCVPVRLRAERDALQEGRAPPPVPAPAAGTSARVTKIGTSALRATRSDRRPPPMRRAGLRIAGNGTASSADPLDTLSSSHTGGSSSNLPVLTGNHRPPHRKRPRRERNDHGPAGFSQRCRRRGVSDRGAERRPATGG